MAELPPLTEEPASDDPDFITALRRQDKQAFAWLVKRYHRSLLQVARAIVGESSAEDVVQEGWVAAYRALPNFEARSSLKTWLTTIVSNAAKTRLRKEQRTLLLDDLEFANVAYPSEDRFRSDGHWSQPPFQWEAESPDELLASNQLHHCLEMALARMPAVQRSVFQLRDLDQTPLSAICNILEVSDSNVRVLLHRARLKLMKVIEHYQETGEC